MKDPYELVAEAEINLDEYVQWQIDFGATNDFREFALQTARAADVFKYAAVLYPKFIQVEGVILLSDHYTPTNWAQWRENHNALESSCVVNHVHVGDLLTSDYQGSEKLAASLGALLAGFWQIAVSHQFPNARVKIEFDGYDVINFSQDLDETA